tara:strand:+ start:70 stop:744 length:675 start_codon:yes stop_codon:yes gene_type:complete
MNKLNEKQIDEVIQKLKIISGGGIAIKKYNDLSITKIKNLTQSEINEIDDAVNKVDSFNTLWGKVRVRLDEPLFPYMWTEWRSFKSLLRDKQEDYRIVLKESLVKYSDFKSDELYDISCVGTYDTDYPIIFFANIVNGEIIGNWVQPHTFWDYWSFRDSIIIDTGSIPNVMPLVLCSIGLPEVFEQNRDNDSLHANLWLYSRDLFELKSEDMEDVSLYAEGGIG